MNLCNNSTPYRRLIHSLEQGTHEDKILLQKIKTGETLSPDELKLYNQKILQVVEKQRLEVKSALFKKGLYSNCCSINALAEADVLTEEITAQDAVERYATAEHDDPYYESPAASATAWTMLSKDPATISVNGGRLSANSQETLQELGISWLKKQTRSQLIKDLPTRISAEDRNLLETNLSFNECSSNLDHLNPGDVAMILFRLKIKTSLGQVFDSIGHTVLIQKITDESYILMDAGRADLIPFSKLEESHLYTSTINSIASQKEQVLFWHKALSIPDATPSELAENQARFAKVRQILANTLGIDTAQIPDLDNTLLQEDETITEVTLPLIRITTKPPASA